VLGGHGDKRRAAPGAQLARGLPARVHRGNMLAHGFTNAMLNGLVREGLATIEPGTVCTGSRRITVVWVAITDDGRTTITV
jgi:hypothetical protein